MPVKNITAEELREMIKTQRDRIEIIDVREPEETQIVRIKNSKLIPMNQLQSRINEIDWNKEVVFICRSGSRSRMIAQILSNSGKTVSNLQYGIYECYTDGKGKNLEILDKEMIGRYLG